MPATEWDLHALAPGGLSSPPTYLATLYTAQAKSIRVERNGTGTGTFAINRSSPECTEDNLAPGNLVRVRLPEISADYLFAFFLEAGDFTLVSSDEKGGEQLTFGGRGNLSYLGYGITWSHSFLTGLFNQEGLWRAYTAGTGNKPGQLLRLLIDEFQHPDRPQQPIPLLVADFDYDVDSDGNPWAADEATAEFTVPVGETGFETLQRLIDTGSIVVEMDPDFTLHAYNSHGRDLTGDAFGAGVVRYQRGVNIATELQRARADSLVATHELIAGETGHYGAGALPDAADRVTREVFNTAFGVSTSPLSRQARADLIDRRNVSEVVKFPIANRRTVLDLATPVTVGAVVGPDATAGAYLPGPQGTDGDFWPGDLVRLHTGSGPFDYDEVDARVKAIVIAREDDAHELAVVPELEVLPPVHTELLAVYLSNSGGVDACNLGDGWEVLPITWPDGSALPYYLATGSGSGHSGDNYISVARAAPGTVLSSVRVCATCPCGGGSLGNSRAMMIFEVEDTLGVISIHGQQQRNYDVGGAGFRWPDVTVEGPALLLAPMACWTSGVPRNDPNTADGWSNFMRFRGTTATPYTIGAGGLVTFATQLGLVWPFGGQHSVLWFVSRANPANRMSGFVQGYDPITGALYVETGFTAAGSGTHSDWDIYMGFESFNDLGDRDLVNCQYQRVSAAGTYGGFQPQGTDTAAVVVIELGGDAVSIGRAGFSGLGEGGSQFTVPIA